MIEHINWYPGHMKKTREMIQENLKLVDVVVEVVDARIPVSGRNPVIDELIQGKPRIVALNKKDLSDEQENREWSRRFQAAGLQAVLLNSMTGDGVRQLFGVLEQMQTEQDAKRPRRRPLRLMVVGVPNAGKSSLINRLIGKKSAKTGDRPGVTRGKQWLSLENGMQLLDTPGILWPRFEDPEVGLNLAFCGAIRDEIMDTASLALELIRLLRRIAPDSLAGRYKLTDEELTEGGGLGTMEAIARRRGFLLPGKRIDYDRTGRTVLDEFRGGLIGRITLEKAEL